MSNDIEHELHTDLSKLNIQQDNVSTTKSLLLKMPQQQQQQVLLLRECIYAIQGISDGTNIIFYRTNLNDDDHNNDTKSSLLSLESVLFCPLNHNPNHHDGDDTIHHTPSHNETKQDTGVTSSNTGIGSYPPSSLSSFLPSNDMMMICGTLGIYVRYLQYFVYHSVHGDSHHCYDSAILRAFRMAVQTELQSYLQFVANFSIPMMIPSSISLPQQQPISSIQELIYHIYPYILRFKLLVMMIASCCVDDIVGTAAPSSSLLQKTENTGTLLPNVVGVNLLSYLYRHLQQMYCDQQQQQQESQPPLVTNLLRSAIQPWLVMLYRWIMDGIISSNEFFITVTPNSTNSSKNDDRYLWHSKYMIQTNRIPQIGLFHIQCRNNPSYNRNIRRQNNDLIDLIFIIGKGVNYIRQCLHDSSWSLLSQLMTVDENKRRNIHQGDDAAETAIATSTTTIGMEQMGFTYESILQQYQQQRGAMTSSTMYTTLERSALLVHRHILSFLHEQFHLMQHLTVLKQFMLFGQGDFYMSFIDSIYAEYPSRQHRTTGMIGIYRHTLSNLFDTSIKGTNAVVLFPLHVLERLDVDLQLDNDDEVKYMFAPARTTNNKKKTMDDTKTHDNHRTVWDTLLLKYAIPDPVVAILHDDAMKIYRSLFAHLFRINHIEYRLHATWRNGSSIHRSLLKNAQHLAIPVNTNADYQQALQLLRTISLSRHSMIHFITSLKGYIMCEVVECGWKRLVSVIHTAHTLDEVISAHDAYLQNIVRQGLFSIEPLSIGLGGRVGLIIDHIRLLLQLVQDFCELQEELFEDTCLAIERAEKKRQDAEQLAKQGSWGFHREREAAEQETCFGLSDTNITGDFDCSFEQFHLLMTSLLQELDATLNGTRNNFIAKNGTKTPSKSDNVTASADEIQKEDVIDLDALRFLATQLNYNVFYGVTNF